MRPPKNSIRLYVLAAIAVLLCLFKACAEEPSPKPEQPLSRVAAWSAVEASIAKTFHVPATGLIYGVYDAFYILPNQDCLDRIEKFRRRLMDGGPFLSEAKDCDDFAREAVYLAKRWSYRYFEGLPATVAFGSAFVYVDGYYSLFSSKLGWVQGYHVLNVYCRNDGQWFWFEPQSGRSEPVESMIYEGIITVFRIEM